MKYITEYKGWNIWQAEDGSMEAWNSKGIISKSERGEKWAKDVKRMVLSSTNVDDALSEIKKRTKKRKEPIYDPYTDPGQTRIE